jgi:hypothetical protein
LKSGFEIESEPETGIVSDLGLRPDDFLSGTLSQTETSYKTAYSDSYESPELEEPQSQDLSPYFSPRKEGGDLPLPTKRLTRVKYEDPWKIHAALVWADAAGKPLPSVVSWNGDGFRLQDKLSPNLFGRDFASQVKNKIHFWDVQDHHATSYILRSHTHWGNALWMYARDKGSVYHSFAVNLKRRLLHFVSGKHDPLLSVGVRAKLLVDPTEVRSKKKRCIRLIELLKTVDGIFLQRYLCYPEEAWNWERYDLFTLQGISILLGDEFLDGEVTLDGLNLTTSYSQLKKSRKTFKMHALRGTLNDHTQDNWVGSLLGPVMDKVKRVGGTRQIFCIGILSQTRGAGRPPPTVSLQSKRDMIVVVSTDAAPFTPTRKKLVLSALDQILRDLPQEAFTGLATKARVTVASSASWEKTRREGGTIEALRLVLESYSTDDPVPIRDLDTGVITDHWGPTGFSTVGEFVFWASLDYVLRTPPEYLTYLFLTVVQEPGKSRTVTKGLACLKIVLDVINKICAWPLKRGIESSTSGMGRSHHAWNYFIRMMSDEMKDDLFKTKTRQEEVFEGYVERTDTYEDFFMSSTDYKEATDAMPLDFSRIAGNLWMRKCGIPRMLIGIVNRVCFKPRTVVFTATGALAQYGEPCPLGEELRQVRMVRGVPMGDPLTKIVLHMVNVVARSLGEGLGKPALFDRFTNSHEAVEAYRSAVLRQAG